MLILSASAVGVQPDYVALAMVLALVLIVVIMVIRKKASNKSKTTEVAAAAVPAEAPQKPAAPGSAGQIKLHNVEPRTAAMIMAIVADKTGKPLNELQFISIKEVQ